MAETRQPLGLAHDNPSAPGISDAERSSSPKLFPIFLNQPPVAVEQRRPAKQRRTKPTGGDSSKLATTICDDDGSRDADRQPNNRLSTYFAPSTPLRVGGGSCGRAPKAAVFLDQALAPAWRRPRKRLGLGFRGYTTRDPVLESLVTRLGPDPRLPPSTWFLPSMNSPTGHDRDYDPALVVAFNSKSKLLTANDASLSEDKRLLAIGGEEGAIKIIDVDAPDQHDSKWWSAHQNGIFDLSWCDDDRHILSASADQSLRLHDVSDGGPRLLACLHGHTSTIKSTALLHESSSNIIVSGGRDGNINLYDLRCRGYSATREMEGSSLRRSSRTRSTMALGSDTQSPINPVLTLRQPHNATVGRRSSADSRSVARTITSLVALRAQPGILASGGSYDGVVKLWDIRCPEPASSLRTKSTLYGSLPDPTVAGGNPSRRPRSVNALCEQPSTGDLYVLCGDSKIHVLRPSASNNSSEAILPRKFVHSKLVTRSFYIRMALSPDGRQLACGSSTGGVMMWDVNRQPQNGEEVEASRLQIPHTSPEAPEVIALDWGKNMIVASTDDCATRIWQSDPVISSQLKLEGLASQGWSGLDRSGLTSKE